ncbi:TetR/AcrR family transcriptional regulator [Neptuniibacter sp. PT8_73]|uniref:TetR/AcrR family transcriptional regulator n=1 Tax=Neptuniibacter sp. PT8_73 TaxID=3398206 RepID=UPI0039F56444
MSDKQTRSKIVEAADQMFYEQGFEHTSFTQIAQAVGISKGNFYYHFKTKNDILDAVIQLRSQRTQEMLDSWEVEGKTAEERILCFVKILIRNQSKIKLFGCPVGTLTTELSKLNHRAQPEANAIFTLFRNWLAEQFTQLGRKKGADSLAMHVLSFSQGVATLAQAFEDETFIQNEVSQITQWLSNETALNEQAKEAN